MGQHDHSEGRTRGNVSATARPKSVGGDHRKLSRRVVLAMSAFIGAAAIGVVAWRGMGGRWWDEEATLDLDFANNRYWWNGMEFSSLSAFLASIGGSVTDGIITFPWNRAAGQIRVDALVSEQPNGNEVLYSLDDGTEANCLRVRRDGASQVVRFFVIAAGTTLSDIGTIPVGRGWVVRTSQSARSRAFNAAINGAGSDAKPVSTAMPVVTTMRIGRGASANTPWSGQIRRVTVSSEPATDVTATIAASRPQHDLWVEGDSYVAGSAGVGLASALARLAGATPLNDGLGGSTLAQIESRMLARSGSMRDLPVIFWDGDNNGYASGPEDLARYDNIISSFGHGRFLVVTTPIRSGQSIPQREAALALGTALRTNYGARIVDPMPILMTMANGTTDTSNVAEGTVPSSLLQDGVHLTGPAMDAVAAVVSTILRERGWTRAIR